MNPKRKSPSEDRLIQELNGPNFTTQPTKITNSRNGRKTLERIVRKWVARGYYSTPSEAMNALLEEI